MPWHTLFVLGAIGSGGREYAEAALAAAGSAPAGRLRRITGGEGGGCAGLAAALADATPDELLLVEDLAAWLPADPGGVPSDLDLLRAAVQACPARLALVGAEVGLPAVPSSADNRRLVEALGALNQAVAGAADAVVLVVAGLPAWLKGGPPPGPATATPATATPATATPATATPATATPATVPVPASLPGVAAAASAAAVTPGAAAATSQPAPDLIDFSGLPLPDEDAQGAALTYLPGRGAGLGALTAVVEFAAGCRADPRPGPWRQVRVLAVQGDHPGAAAAGEPGSAARADALRAGTAPLAVLAARAGASVQIVEAAPAGPIEAGAAMPADQVDPALAHGWQLAEQAADEGVDLLVLASIGDGAETAAAAITTLLVPGTEPAGLLGRVRTARGTIDDAAWMRRTAAARDAVRRVRAAPRGNARLWLAELGGPGLAVTAGLLIGAAARRTPVLLDGPLGAAAGLVARNLAPASRRWWLLPDTGGHPLVVRAAEALSLTPLLNLRLDLGEGAAALAALPLLQTALSLLPAAPWPHPAPPASTD